MANDDRPRGFKPVKTVAGKTPLIVEFELATSQTIAEGDALTLSSGQAAIATASSGNILGFAAEAKTTGGTAANIKMYPAERDTIFEGQTSGTLAQSNLGSAVDIEGATGVMEINENATTEQVVQLLELAPTTNSDQTANAFGANADVRFKVLRSAWDGLLAAL